MSDDDGQQTSRLARMPTLQVEAILDDLMPGENAEATEMLSREELFRNAAQDRAGHRESKATIPTPAEQTRQLPPGALEMMRDAARYAREHSQQPQRRSVPPAHDEKTTTQLNPILSPRQQWPTLTQTALSVHDPALDDKTLETTIEQIVSVAPEPRLFELEAQLDQDYRVEIPRDLAAYLKLKPGARVVIFLQSEEK